MKNLEELGLVLKGNFGLKAKRNPSGSIAFRLQRRIKGKDVLSKTLGYFPQMFIKEAEKQTNLNAMYEFSNCYYKGIPARDLVFHTYKITDTSKTISYIKNMLQIWNERFKSRKNKYKSRKRTIK